MSEALRALYAGDRGQAEALLPADGALTVFEAAAFGRVARLTELLLEDSSRATTFSADGFTPLHLAVFGGQEAAARALIEAGADVNALSRGAFAVVPPLGTAAFVRSLPLARLLLDAGADVNGRGEGGFTALHAAAQNGDEPLARLLLERGADPGATTGDGRRPADIATSDGMRAMLGAA